MKSVILKHEGKPAARASLILSAVKNFASGVGWLTINNQ